MQSINTKAYIEKHLKIKNKDAQIIPLILNKPQQKLYDTIKRQYELGRPIRIIILKARQMGFSTITEGILFKETATEPNIKTGIVTHEETATKNLFNMTKMFYANLPAALKPQTIASNAQELIFNNKERTGLNSNIKCMTAGNGNIGRSDTFQKLHISEYAFWPGNKVETLTGLLQAVPNTPESIVIIESTANGYEDFKQLWDDAVEGKSDYIPVFCAWHELEEYRMDASDLGELTQEEIELKELYHLDNEQIAWRRWCIRNNCRGDLNKFNQEYPSCPEEAFISSGACVFNKKDIVNRIEQIRQLQPLKQGSFKYKKTYEPVRDADGNVVRTRKVISDIEFVEEENGIIRIYEEPQVKKDKEDVVTALCPYTIGGDTAEEGEDYYTAKVINNLTDESVATLQVQFIDEDLYADQIYCLGIYYNTALIGIEINYSRKPMRELEDLNYPSLYMRERVDTLSREIVKAYGFRTDSATRPVIISELVETMRDDITRETDIQTLREMLTFVRKTNGRKEAQDGFHDDLVMASAIAHFIAKSQGEHKWIAVKHEEFDFIKENFSKPQQQFNSYMEW